MRRIMFLCVTLGILLTVDRVSQAGGKDVDAIIDKAIKAHLGSSKQTPKKGYRGKNKGTLFIMGLELEFTQEVAVQAPEKFKELMEISVMGANIKTVTVFNGKEAWITAGGKEVKVGKEILEEFKDVGSLISISQGIFEKDKNLKYDVIGEDMVNGKPAIGLKITREGRKPIDVYFDKATGLQVKIERMKRDLMNDMDVTEERIILEYKDIDGRKFPKKVLVKVDGKKLLEVEVLESQFLDKVDDSEFVRPQ